MWRRLLRWHILDLFPVVCHTTENKSGTWVFAQINAAKERLHCEDVDKDGSGDGARDRLRIHFVFRRTVNDSSDIEC
jgi:hypothetical protein